MFTYIRLKNFMSIQDAFFDFRASQKNVKRFVAIYGENGSGKSNFVNSISFLRRSIDSFDMGEALARAQEAINGRNIPKEVLEELMEKFMRNQFDFSASIENCRMIDCEEETRVEYGFKVNGHQGIYELAFCKRFTYERLYYYTGKQTGQLFEIKLENEEIAIKISPKLCKQDSVRVELEHTIQKYWGKHTLLSILSNERKKKNNSYIQANYLSYTFDLIDMLEDVMIHQKDSSSSISEYRSKKPYNALEMLDEGTIKRKYAHILAFSERILKDFFTQTYADIKDVYYRKTEEKEKIKYQLYVEKMVGGKLRELPFSKESAGTQHVLEIIRSLLGAFCGVTVVYDEIDDGIHDLLLKNILSSMIDDITGQLIITTHNTYLLEELDIKSIYVIDGNYLGEKEVHCLSEYPRIQGSNNPRRMYLKGMFGGVPITDMVDYTEIIGELQELESSEEE